MDVIINEYMYAQETSFTEDLISYVKAKCRLNIVKWNPGKKEYPKYMLLGPDKGILAYVNFNVCKNNVFFQHDYELLLNQLKLSVSDLDRPVFNIYQSIEKNEKNIYFETYEQLIDILLNEPSRVELGKNGEKIFYSSKVEMGTINELLNIFLDLKKNNVRVN